MICLQNRNDCIFNALGFCSILSDTHFRRACPFYKQQVEPPPRDYEFEGHNGTFRAVSGFGGKYYVSEYGEVINKKGNTLARKLDRYGYPVVQLRTLQNTQTTAKVARLVAMAFMSGVEQVEHIDGNKLNCELTNLRRIT